MGACLPRFCLYRHHSRLHRRSEAPSVSRLRVFQPTVAGGGRKCLTACKPKAAPLARRERQVMDVPYKLERATVAGVLAELPAKPSYSTVRAQSRSDPVATSLRSLEGSK